MTREEAVELLCYGDWLNVISEHIGKTDTERIAEAMSIVGKALRPVSREQVEKVWRGEWNNINPAVLKPGVSWVCRCAKCGCPQDYKHNFCPNCGAAQTDEAVEMVMERLEALRDNHI